MDKSHLSIDIVTAHNIFITSSSGFYTNYSNITLDDIKLNVSSFCSSTATLTIMVSATNIFGEGPPSNPIMIGKLSV